MAGEKNLLNKLARQASQFDENALASFANKGLLRRARKDFDADATNIVALESADDKAVKLRVAESIVTLTEKGLTESVCDCASTEVCRHILIACFWLAAQTVESEQDKVVSVDNGDVDKDDATIETLSKTPKKSAFQDLLDIALSSLEKVAGKKNFAQAVEFFTKNVDCKVSIAAEDIRLVEFAQSNVAVRLLKDADVKSHLCSCRSAEICRHKIAAILAFKRENNVEFLPDSIDKGESAFVLSESQTKVLRKTIELFAEFVEIGASHLSESSVERLQTLATSAGGASLFRLSSALKSLADGLRLSLNRSAQSDETAWLMFLAKTHALAASLLASNVPNKQFIGTSRTVYDEIGALEIAGIGAYQWQTLSGFHGVTVLFWDDKGKRFFSWTDARPKSDATFSPYSAFCGEMRWQGVSSPSQAAISNLKLQNAANNSQNRLSGSGQIQGFVLSATDVEKLDFGANDFSNWNEIRRYFAKIYPCGLRERESFKEFAVVRPKRFGNRHFDSTTQTFVWEIFDGDENAVDIRLKFDEYNETAIQMLEKLDLRHDEIKGIVARLATGANGLYLQPISLFVKAKSDFFSKLFKKDDDSIRVVHLNLSAKPDKPDKKVDAKKIVADENAIDEDENALEGLSAKGAIPQKLLAVRETLQNLAERGTNSIPANAFESLTHIAESLKIAGLSSVAAPISDFTRLPRNELSANLLKLVFLVELSLEIAQTNR